MVRNYRILSQLLRWQKPSPENPSFENAQPLQVNEPSKREISVVRRQKRPAIRLAPLSRPEEFQYWSKELSGILHQHYSILLESDGRCLYQGHEELHADNVDGAYQLMLQSVPGAVLRHRQWPTDEGGRIDILLLQDLWQALLVWSTDCSTCARLRRRLPNHQFDPIKAAERRVTDLELEIVSSVHCPECTLILRCLRAYYPSFEDIREHLRFEIYPDGSAFDLLVRNLQSTSWTSSSALLQVFEGRPGRQESMRLFDASSESTYDWLVANLPPVEDFQPKFMPKRLIRIHRDGTRLNLIDTRLENAPYCALSYCWGDKTDNLKLTRANLKEYSAKLNSSCMPKTLRDAVQVCSRLGVEFLWVDALCIIQDDDQSLDWYEQSAQMEAIYSHAYLVIAADSALDCSYSFLRSWKSEDLEEFQVKDIYGGNWLCRQKPQRQRDDPDFLLRRTPLSRRAWTLQETLLPTTVAHFTGTEIVLRIDDTFQCQCGCCTGFEHVRTEKFYWYKIVSLYSSRRLSNASDKLTALSGLASRVASPSDHYFAGLWQSNLARDLLWYVAEGPGPDHVRSKTWRAPTWSWASMDGCVAYFSRYRNYEFAPSVRILQVECALCGPDPFGQISSGFLRLTGMLVPVQLVVLEEPFQQHPYEYNGEHGKSKRVHDGRTFLVRGNSTGVYEVLCDERMELTTNLSTSDRMRWLDNQVDKLDLSASPFFCLEIGEFNDFNLDLEPETSLSRSFREWFMVLKLIDMDKSVYERVGVGYKSSRNNWSTCDLFSEAHERTIRLE